MTIRSGMYDLINRLRKMTNAETDQYTIGSEVYWTDDHLQTILDRHADYVVEQPLTWRPVTVGGTAQYFTAETTWQNFEKAESGTTRWAIRDTGGNLASTANYSSQYDRLRVTFTSNQAGTVDYRLTGYSYDIHRAAVEVIEDKIAYIDLWYDFSDNNQSFSRSQVLDNLKLQRDIHKAKAGDNTPNKSGEVGSSYWFRTDVNI